jgi:hypothetical protein
MKLQDAAPHAHATGANRGKPYGTSGAAAITAIPELTKNA